MSANIFYYITHRKLEELEEFVKNESIKENEISIELLIASILLEKESIKNIILDIEYISSRSSEQYNGSSLWHYLAFSGNWDILERAVDDGMFYKYVTNNIGDTIYDV